MAAKFSLLGNVFEKASISRRYFEFSA